MRKRSGRGETLIEFSLALTLFLMTVLGTAEFGLAVFRYNMVSDLAQEGVRRASVCCTRKGLSSTECDIAAYVSSRALGLSVNVTPPPNLATAATGDVVEVQVRHTFNPLTKIVPMGAIT